MRKALKFVLILVCIQISSCSTVVSEKRSNNETLTPTHNREFTTTPSKTIAPIRTSTPTATDENRQTTVAKIKETRTVEAIRMQNQTATVNALTPSSTPSSTPPPTNTLVPTSTPTNTDQPTITNTPNPPEPFLISYRVVGGDGVDEVQSCLLWWYDYSFVLYENGRLIFLKDGELKEAFLSNNEIDNLLANIERTNYYDVEGTGELLLDDSIYSNPPERIGDGGPGKYLRIKDKTIYIYFPLEEYLVEPIKQTLKLIETYQPSEYHSYEPKKIGFWIFPIKNSENINWSISTPIPPIEKWPSTLEPLSTIYNDYNYGKLEGKDVELVIDLFDLFPSSRVFIEDGQEFYVVACPILP